MLRTITLTVAGASLIWAQFSHGATIGNDGGISLSLSYAGDLGTDKVVDDRNKAVTDDAGQQLSAKAKLEYDLQLFAGNIFALSEGKHYIRNVVISDRGRGWDTADVRWDPGAGLSGATAGGWQTADGHIIIKRAWRKDISAVLTREFAAYFYGVGDEYASPSGRTDYYQGIRDGKTFQVIVEQGCPSCLSNPAAPLQFCDKTDHSIKIKYQCPVSKEHVTEVLTPAVLLDGDPGNDGPINGRTGHPFAMDAWSIAAANHAELVGHHDDGVRARIVSAKTPAPAFDFKAGDESAGQLLLVDCSGVMTAEEFGIPSTQYLQEAALFFCESAPVGSYVGAYSYGRAVAPVVPYGLKKGPVSPAPLCAAGGVMDLSQVLRAALDVLVRTHGAAGTSGAEIFLVSNGRGDDDTALWRQVERAADLRVQINVFSYGDIDTVTMARIAGETRGHSCLLSQPSSDLMNLKTTIAKAVIQMRGLTTVCSDVVNLTAVDAVDEIGTYAAVEFTVPKDARSLEFYAMPMRRVLQPWALRLVDPAGGTVLVPPTPAQQQGRFAAQTVARPLPGVWKAEVVTDKIVDAIPLRAVQLFGYVDASLSADLWCEADLLDVRAGHPRVRVCTSLSSDFPITELKAGVHVHDTLGRWLATVAVNDDGEAGDEVAGDGVHSGILDTEAMRRTDATTLTLKAELQTVKGSTPAPNCQYELDVDYEAALRRFRPSIVRVFAERFIGFSPTMVRAPALEVELENEVVRKTQLGDIEVTTLTTKPETVRPGRIYVRRIRLYDAPLGEGDVRVGLGQGITVLSIRPSTGARGWRAEEVTYAVDRDYRPIPLNEDGYALTREQLAKRDLRTGWYDVRFRVDKDAAFGVRDLQVQVDGELLTIPAYLDVVEGWPLLSVGPFKRRAELVR